MMMKKKLALFICFVMFFSMFAACSQAPEQPASAGNDSSANDTSTEAPAAETKLEPAPAASSDVTLSVMTNMTGVVNETFDQVCKDFTAQTGIKIEYSAPANDYEALMKAKMASNDLPDVFSTHGWSVLRYSTFLRPLNDQPWFSDIESFIEPIITDDAGNVFVLPIDMDIAGICYNRDILEEVGVKVEDIKTWSDFEATCEKVKAAGYTPVYLGGRDDWTIGQFFDWVAPSFYITNEASNDRQALLDGTFDWKKWGPLAEMFGKWSELGYLNVDAATSDYDTCTAQLGAGKVAFEFFGNYAIVDANSKGNANLGMMPIPANSTDDTPTLIAGERLAVGVWKDSPHMEEAMQFLDYLATPEVIVKLATADGMPAGLKGLAVDTGAVAQDYEKYADVRTFPYFDRIYLPNGMWNDLCDTGLGILNKSMSADEIIAHMETSYLEKLQQ